MLLAHIQAANTDQAAQGFDGSYSNHHFYWYLMPDNVELEEDGIAFIWGKGRSGHTWRDFKGTLQVLNQYLVPNVYVPIEVADEYDGFETTEIVHMNCSNPFNI